VSASRPCLAITPLEATRSDSKSRSPLSRQHSRSRSRRAYSRSSSRGFGFFGQSRSYSKSVAPDGTMPEVSGGVGVGGGWQLAWRWDEGGKDGEEAGLKRVFLKNDGGEMSQYQSTMSLPGIDPQNVDESFQVDKGVMNPFVAGSWCDVCVLALFQTSNMRHIYERLHVVVIMYRLLLLLGNQHNFLRSCWKRIQWGLLCCTQLKRQRGFLLWAIYGIMV
jgi:hypothetical protein